MARVCVPPRFSAGASRLERGAAALAVARQAHVKPTVWRRYDGVRRRFGIFREEEFGVRPEVEPFDIEHVVAWLGVRIADKVVSADTEIAALNKFHVRAGGTPLRDDVRIQEALTGWGRTKPLPVKKKPLTGAMIGKSAARWDESSLLGARAAAMLAAGHGGALRGPSELLAMQLPLRVVAQGSAGTLGGVREEDVVMVGAGGVVAGMRVRALASSEVLAGNVAGENPFRLLVEEGARGTGGGEGARQKQRLLAHDASAAEIEKGGPMAHFAI